VRGKILGTNTMCTIEHEGGLTEERCRSERPSNEKRCVEYLLREKAAKVRGKKPKKNQKKEIFGR